MSDICPDTIPSDYTNFVYDKGSHASTVYYAAFEAPDGKCLFIAFQDTTRAGAEKQDYIKALSMGKSGYSEEGLSENDPYFGLFLLETNNFEASEEKIFCHYKDHWSIDPYYNYVKNDIDFNALNQQDYFSMQGLSFIVTVSGLIYHNIKIVADKSKLTVREIMEEMRKLKISKKGSNWFVQNQIKSVRGIADKTDFIIPAYVNE